MQETTASPHTPDETLRELVRKIETKRAIVGVLGLGYVGLPLVSAFCDAGLRVIGFDTDPRKIDLLGRGENYLRHLGQTMTARLHDSGRFEATGQWDRLSEPDALLVCVPTPLDARKEPDLRFVERSMESIAAVLRRGQLVVLESTTYPGTTRNVVAPILRRSGLEAGRDFLLAYSPERQDPGRVDWDTRTTPKLVGGIDEASSEVAAALYGAVVANVHRVGSAEVAETAKLLENIYRAVNIALVNELKVILDAMDIDVWEVIEASATKPFGFMKFTPGPGLGGHCIPIDPFYMSWVARKAGHATRFIELAGEINARMPHYVVDRTRSALRRAGKPIQGARIMILGLAYKENVDDVRESPAVRIIEILEELGASVRYSDPHVPEPPAMRGHDLNHLRSVDLDENVISDLDALIVVTNHRAFDWDMIARHARCVVDTRNALGDKMLGDPRYFRA